MTKINSLNAWSGNSGFSGRRSAQSYFKSNAVFSVSGSCGSACGAGDEEPKPDSTPDPKPSACGAGE